MAEQDGHKACDKVYGNLTAGQTILYFHGGPGSYLQDHYADAHKERIS